MRGPWPWLHAVVRLGQPSSNLLKSDHFSFHRGLDWSRSRGQNPECWDLAVKESSDSEPRHGAGKAEGEGGGWVQKKWAPRSIVFSLRFARARVSLSCKRALPCSGRRCACAKVSLVSADAPRHGSAPAWRTTPGLFRVARCLCFWRALGKSAQAEQDTLILCSSQESVRFQTTEGSKHKIHQL